MRGINAAEIGSDGSVACQLTVGIDNRMQNKIARKNLEISQKQKEQEVLKSQIAELRNGEEALEERIGELTKMRKSSAIVKDFGTIYDRTAIQVPKASLIVNGTLQRVTIQELKKNGRTSRRGMEDERFSSQIA